MLSSSVASVTTTRIAAFASACSLGLGTAAGLIHPLGRLAALATAVWAAATTAAFMLRSGGFVRLVAMTMLVAVLGFASGSVRAGTRAQDPVRTHRGPATVCGTIDRITETRVHLRVDRFRPGPRARVFSTRSLVTVPPFPESVSGSRWCIDGELLPPGGFGDTPHLIEGRPRRLPTPAGFRAAAGALRESMRRVAARLEPDDSALLLGMTIGDTRGMSDDLKEAFRNTGLTHLVAVSGSNVAVLVTLVAAACAALGLGRGFRAALVLPCLVFFAFLTQGEPSVLRASVAAGTIAILGIDGYRLSTLGIAVTAGTLLIAFSPELLTSVGFQLSFGATLGLIAFSGPIASKLKPWLPKGIVDVVAATAAAQVTVAPLLVLHFGLIPGLGALANLIVAPLAGLVMVGGGAVLLAGVLFEPLSAAVWLVWPVLKFITGVAGVFASLPAATIRPSPAAALLAPLAVGLLFLRGPPRLLSGCASVALIGFLAVQPSRSLPPECDGPSVTMLDIAGTSVLVQRGHGAPPLLFDAGGRDARPQDRLRELGITKVVGVATHPHADHIDAFRYLARERMMDTLLVPPNMAQGSGEALLSDLSKHRTQIRNIGRGSDVGGPDVGVLEPDLRISKTAEIDRHSLVIAVDMGGWSVLIPGDANSAQQRRLTGRLGSSLRSTVLVGVHHGSADLDPDFVDSVAPQVTLIGVDPDNPYGHPTQQAIQMYGNHGEVLRNDRQGTLTVCGGRVFAGRG